MCVPEEDPTELTPKEQVLIDQLHKTAEEGSVYALLGVPSDADAKQIRRAYYNMSRSWHPDRFFRRSTGPYREKIEAIFVAVTAAYQTLSDDTLRREYDQEHPEEPPEAPQTSPERPRSVQEASGSSIGSLWTSFRSCLGRISPYLWCPSDALGHNDTRSV